MSPILGIWASQNYSRIPATSYESIATATVTSGGTSSVTFSSIPQTYKHLQVRILLRAIAAGDYTYGTFRVGNGSVDTGYNYWYHGMSGLGAGTPASTSSGSTNYGDYALSLPGDAMSSGVYGVAVVDFLDYANTNKYKTVRSIYGYDNNGTGGTDTIKGRVGLNSTVWNSTSAINTIQFVDSGAYPFQQYTSIALYGIKG